MEPGLDVGAPEEVDLPGVLLPGVQDEGPTLWSSKEISPQRAISDNSLSQAENRPQTL